MKKSGTAPVFPFTVKYCLGLVLLYSPVIPILFFSPFLVAKLLFDYPLARNVGLTSSNFIAWVIAAQVFASVVLYLVISRRLKATNTPWSSLGLRRFNVWRAVKYIAGWPLVLVAAGIIILIVTSVLGLKPPDNAKDTADSFLSGNLFLGVVLASLIAPLIEEIIFRGMLFSAISAKYSYGYGIALSTLVFSVIHLNPLQMLTAIILGTYLCWMYKKLNSIYPGMILHALHNGAVTLLFFSR